MKKTIFIILLISGSVAGYLYYDWYGVIHVDDADRYAFMYSWTDKQGQTHFSDQNPPQGAANIKKLEVLKQPDDPLFVRLQESLSNFIYDTKESFAATTGSSGEESQDLSAGSAAQVTGTQPIKRRWPTKKRKGKT